MRYIKSKKYIPFSPPWMTKMEEVEVIDSLRSGWITTGPKVTKFEKKIASYLKAKYAVSAFSCTSAMQLALSAIGIKEGDEVITTPFTFASTSHVICYHRARPVFVDVEKDTFNIDPAKIKEQIRRKTRAIMPVHYAGHSCDMDRIMAIAKKYQLCVVEDAAHAIGTEYKGKKIGSIGDITCFSFYATKNLATAEGGMATTRNRSWAQRMRILAMYGISDARQIWHKRYSKSAHIHYDVVELGYKCNMTDLCASLGLQQLSRLEMFNRVRQEYAQLYNNAFKNHPGVCIPVVKEYTKANRHLYPLLLNLDYLSISRDRLVAILKDNNIGTSVLFKPLHLHTYYAKLLNHRYGDFPVSEGLFERVVCLPISPKLGKAAIKKIADTLLHFLKKFKK